MGQPLSAIMLNLHLIEQLPANDERYGKALSAIRFDARRMVDLLEQMKQADARQTAEYFGSTAILELGDSKDDELTEEELRGTNVVQMPTRNRNPLGPK